jgi:uncharacterized protein with von Willebrand factor type A (vWA) domain
MKALVKSLAVVLAVLFAASGCGDSKGHARAVYVLVDTSGTYAKELDKANYVITYLLSNLNAGDSLAVARVKSRSFSEKDILAKVTFEKDPLQVNAQKLAFKQQIAKLAQQIKGGSAFTDITGGILQGSEFLNETGAARKTIVIFSDMQEELDKQVKRDLPLNLKGIRIIALNVTKLETDNIDPQRYMNRLQWWEKRVRDAGATEWRMVNDLEHLERVFGG